MVRITIAIAIGTALLIGALMYGAANQAFAATHCSLTVGTPSDEEYPASIIGKLICGGIEKSGATIHLTLHHITTGRTTTASTQTVADGSYEKGAVLGHGHSYTATAYYAGDSDNQQASATTSINIKSDKPLVNQAAGNTQQNNSTQASAATPCDLTVGTPSDEAVPGSIIGKLSCGGHGISHATIKISGLPGGSTESTTTSTDGRYEQGVFSSFSAGQSYTVTAKYDGDSDHQPASATTSVNIKGSTGSTQQNNNAGNTQQNNSTQP
jgi:hypothetical protein